MLPSANVTSRLYELNCLRYGKGRRNRKQQVNVICHTANLQGVHPVFARDTAEISEETFANRLDEKWIAILRAEDDMIMQRGVGICHRFQASLRDATRIVPIIIPGDKSPGYSRLPLRGFSFGQPSAYLPLRAVFTPEGLIPLTGGSWYTWELFYTTNASPASYPRTPERKRTRTNQELRV